MRKKMKLNRDHKSGSRGLWKCWLFKHLKTISILLNKSNVVKLITEQNSSVPPATITTTTTTTTSEFLETAVEALRSNRLFFDPGTSNSILGAARFPFKDCVALALETQDPYSEFRVSMEEVVEACGVREGGHLEELLAWYLRMNRKKNHVFIVGAFIEVFTGIASSSCSSSSVFVTNSSSRIPKS